MSIQLALLLVYSAGLVLIGVLVGRRVESSGAFFVAGRRLGPVLLFATVLAANIGAGSTVGAAGLGYRDGLAGWWWVGSAGIGTVFLALWVGPRIWRIARERGLYTLGDYLEVRYGPSVRATVAIILWLGTLAILAAQLMAVAFILDVVAGVPKAWGCIIGGVVMTAYFTAGGLVTSAWVNLVQLVVLWGGFLLALPLVLKNAGGWSALAQSAPASAEHYFGFFRGGGSGWTYLILLGPAFIVSPGLVQKVYGAHDERAIRLGVGASAIALMVFAAMPPLLGMLAHVYAPSLPKTDLALPTVLISALPPAVGGLALAAVFSAELSSADAILFMLSTSLSQDLYKRFVQPAATDRQVLAVSRAAAVVGGSLGVALAIVLPSVIASLTIFYTLLTVSLFVPVAAGLHSRRAGTVETLAAIVGGVGVVAVMHVGAMEHGMWTAGTAGLLASAVVFFTLYAVRRTRGR